MRRFGIYLGGRKAELPAPTSPLPLMGVQSAEVPGDATGEGDARTTTPLVHSVARLIGRSAIASSQVLI